MILDDLGIKNISDLEFTEIKVSTYHTVENKIYTLTEGNPKRFFRFLTHIEENLDTLLYENDSILPEPKFCNSMYIKNVIETLRTLGHITPKLFESLFFNYTQIFLPILLSHLDNGSFESREAPAPVYDLDRYLHDVNSLEEIQTLLVPKVMKDKLKAYFLEKVGKSNG